MNHIQELSLREFKQKRINSVMEANGLDMIICSTHCNIFYTTGFRSTAERALALITRKGVYALVIPYIEAASASEALKGVSLYCHGTFKFDFEANSSSPEIQLVKELEANCHPSEDSALVQALLDSGIRNGRIGIDESFFIPQTWFILTAKFPEIDFIPAASMIYQIRSIKHPYEIHCLERAAEIAEQSIIAVTEQLQLGMTEQDLGWMFNAEVSKRRADVHFNVIAIDEHSAFSDTQRTDQKVVNGSHIRFDVSCDYLGYKSDIARTAVVGKFNHEIADAYASIQYGQETAIAAMKPGVSACEIFDIAVKNTVKTLPSFRRHHVGHGIGIEMYDSPLINAATKDPLEAGMVFCIETPYYRLGWGGVQVEDAVEITENGHHYLTKSSRDLIKINI